MRVTQNVTFIIQLKADKGYALFCSTIVHNCTLHRD